MVVLLLTRVTPKLLGPPLAELVGGYAGAVQLICVVEMAAISENTGGYEAFTGWGDHVKAHRTLSSAIDGIHGMKLLPSNEITVPPSDCAFGGVTVFKFQLATPQRAKPQITAIERWMQGWCWRYRTR